MCMTRRGRLTKVAWRSDIWGGRRRRAVIVVRQTMVSQLIPTLAKSTS